MTDSNFIKTALHYGALNGIGIFLFYMLVYFLGFNVFGPATIAGAWIPVVFVVLAIKFHRDQNLGGVISYRQGLSMGLVTTLFSSTLFGLAFYLFGTLLDPGIVESYKIQAEQSLEEGKSILPDAMFDRAMESIELVTMGSLSFSESFNKIIGGGFVSFIAAAFLKRKSLEESNE